jgi:hypothetical protein
VLGFSYYIFSSQVIPTAIPDTSKPLTITEMITTPINNFNINIDKKPLQSKIDESNPFLLLINKPENIEILKYINENGGSYPDLTTTQKEHVMTLINEYKRRMK